MKARVCQGLWGVAVVFAIGSMLVGTSWAAEHGTYVETHVALRQAIRDALPALDEQAFDAYDAARANLAVAQTARDDAQKNLQKINDAQRLVEHARNRWIRNAESNIEKAQEELAKATSEEGREKARATLASAEQNKRDGQQALKERQANLDAVRENEEAYHAAYEAATAELQEAEAQLLQATHALPVIDVLKSDSLDEKLVRFVVMEEWGPANMDAFAAQGEQQKALVYRLLGDTDLMREMLVADGAADGNYGRAMEILAAIQAASPHAAEGTLRRLAVAISLVHASPVSQRNPIAAVDAPAHVDPVNRYLHFEKAYLGGELDPSFSQHDIWHYRWVVDGYEPDDILVWGREMLRNYRPDHIYTENQRWRYVGTVRTEVPYGSQWNKYDRDELQFFQNILMNGGICGRRAFFGRFILRAFGVPTAARPSPGHAALVRWTPDGWVPVLGPGWGRGRTHTPYGRDVDFLQTTQARAVGEDAFLQVRRAQWVGRTMGEPSVWGEGGRQRQVPGRWHDIALRWQTALIHDAEMAALDAVGEELGEADVKEDEVIAMPDTDVVEEIVVHADGRITIPAVTTTTPGESTSKIMFHKSFLGGQQLHYSRAGEPQDFSYTVEVPRAGTYALRMRYVVNTDNQPLQLLVNNEAEQLEMLLPLTLGMWETTEPVTIALQDGKNTLTFSRSGENVRGLTIKDFTLTPVD